MIPMFRVRSNGTARSIEDLAVGFWAIVRSLVVWDCYIPPAGPSRESVRQFVASWISPAVVRERLVRVSHLVDVFPLLDRVATVLRGVDDLVRETVDHRLLVTLAGVLDEPAHTERERAVRANVDGHLVRRTTDAAALHLDARADVTEGALPDLHRVVLGALCDHVERTVDDAFSGRLLAIAHDDVDELRQTAAHVGGGVGVLRVREDLALRYFTFTRHGSSSLLRALRAVLAARLLAVLDAGGVQRAADDVVTDAREVLHTTATDEDDRVLLQVVSLARDVRRHFH